MRVLHYSLGLPPYRTGGLTKYSLDLMEEQITQGHNVSMCYPGSFKLNNKLEIQLNTKYRDISVYELINPQLVPLLGGVKNPADFIKGKNEDIIRKFLIDINPQIVHIHTLMGLPKEFIKIAKELRIKTIFTTHDYFGICPKVNLIDNDGIICSDFREGEKCIECNKSGYSKFLIYFMQSKIYRKNKNNSILKTLKKYKRGKKIKYRENQVSGKYWYDNNLAKDYIKLRKYYLEMLKSIDLIHFNSNISKKVYEQYGIRQGHVLEITHKNIIDKRKIKEYSSKIKFFYLGNIEKHKGIFLLFEALQMILEEGYNNWTLNIYGNTFEIDVSDKLKDHINFHGRYNYEKLENIMYENDALIVPSIWYETFGFIVKEAQSFGVPVIVTDCVGAKDIIKDNDGGLIVYPNKEHLKESIYKYIKNKELISQHNKNICKKDIDFSIGEHVNKLVETYYK
ncbi:glycosyltransferase [Clostridium hydrogeniformans]|uniref:glycosyltransferase n=1 Tax=Clostridium hydrogeniformans TaxID=349933 RepID=UPI0004833341|nr:glycosyltransferase [Clostridium hydrogeniformans]